MNHIGNVIKEYRGRQHLCRKELSDGICSEKYLYLIERGERTPSAEVLRLLSNRLGVDLFEYYQYLDCKDPFKVRESMFLCVKYRRTGKFLLLSQLNEEMKKLPDFLEKPWKYEVYVNQYMIWLHVGKEPRRIVEEMEEILLHLEPEYADEVPTARLYIVLSTTYQLLSDMENAKRTLAVGEKILSNKKDNSQYTQTYISTKIIAMSLAQRCKDYKKAIEDGLDLVHYQEETNSYERSNMIYYFLAIAYYMDGQQENGIKWFEKSVLNLLARYRPTRANLIYTNEVFSIISKDPLVNKELLAMLKETYDFIQ